jgi:hypothetical protein
MKITTGMVEAGVSALARNRKQTDGAVVAAVFSAMIARKGAEDARAVGKAQPPKERTFWPSFRYGPDGKGKVFQSAEEVPEGWTDSPKAVAAPEPEKRKPGRPKTVAA